MSKLSSSRTRKQKFHAVLPPLEEREAWKEAFFATRAYFFNNTGENSKRYREAVARLKEMKLIR